MKYFLFCGMLLAGLVFTTGAVYAKNQPTAPQKSSPKVQEQYTEEQRKQLERAESLYDKAGDLYQQGKYKAGIEPAKEALDIRQHILVEDHLDIAQSLNGLAILYRDMGEYAEAEPLFQHSLAIREKALGNEHPDVMDTLSHLASLYQLKGAYDKSKPLFERVLATDEKLYGKDHINTTKALNNLAVLYESMGKYKEAEPLFKKSLTISEKSLGSEHLDVASLLQNLAILYHLMGRYKEAKPLYEKALSIREKILGREHPYISQTLSSLAALYQAMGDYEKSEDLQKQAIKIDEKTLGEEHIETAKSINNLGVLYDITGEYDKAMPLLKKSLAIRKKVLGEMHPMIVTILNNIGSLYKQMGNDQEALVSFDKALEISEKVLGDKHPTTGICLDNLGSVYMSLHNYKQAKVIFEHSLSINKKALGKENFDTAVNMNNLSASYREMGNYTEAESLAEDALRITERIVGKEHLGIATILTNLAEVYQDQGNFTKAVFQLEQALAIREKKLGTENPDTANTLASLSKSYFYLKDYAKAETLAKQALFIREKKLGLMNPDTLTSIANLAEITVTQDQWKTAYTYTSRLFDVYQKTIDPLKELTAQNDNPEFSQQRSRSYNMRLHLKAIFHLLADANADTGELISHALTTLQLAHDPRNSQAMVLAALKLAGDDPEHRKQVNALVTALHKRDQSLENFNASFTPSPKNTPEKRANLKHYLEEAEGEITDSLSTLKNGWPTFNTLIDSSPLTAGEADDLLQPYEAILAYAGGGDESYLIVLRKNHMPSLHKLDITRKVITEKIGLLRQGLKTKGADGTPHEVLPDFDMVTAHGLYQQLISPALKELNGISHLIIVPDNIMQNLPFATLLAEPPPTGKDAYRQAHWLVRDYSLSQLPSLASLRMVRKTGGTSAAEPFIGFGDPALQGKKANAAKGRGQDAENVQLAFASREASTLSDVKALNDLEPLPETEAELNALAARFQADDEQHVFLKERATEGQLKKLDKGGILGKQRVLAFSTHALLASEGSSAGFQTGAESGLVFTPPLQASSEDDGYLTASEASRLTLNADWVLLSACNTGVVENKTYAAANANQAGQDTGGLSSLAKSFFHAGSRNLLVTQWNVFDPTGSQIVPSLFKESSSGNKSQRLQQAMLKIVDQGLEYFDGCLRDEDDQTVWQRLSCPIKNLFRDENAPNAWAHPYYWAPYTIVGDGV